MRSEGPLLTGQAAYLGSSDRRLFAFDHAGRHDLVSVLVCPPLGYEGVVAHEALRQLAERLNAEGHRVLRLDYDGTGNSVGDDTDDDRVNAWVRSVGDALDHLLATGTREVVVVGLRVGATIAARAAQDRPEVSAMVLWDPVLSGRRFARVLRMMSSGQPEAADAMVGGIRYTAQTLRDLRRLDLPTTSRAARTLVIAPTEGSLDLDHPLLTGPGVEVRRHAGTVSLLDTDAELSVVPQPVLETISDWVHALPTVEPATPSTAGLQSVTIAREQGAVGELEHEALRVGEDRLFAVVTRPTDQTSGLAVVMVNNGVARHLGPGRAWVEWARELAADGHTTLRLDLAGLGDSPAGPGRTGFDSYPVTAGRNIRDAVHHLRDQGAAQVVVLGLCSGALLSFDGLLLDPSIDGVVSINPRFDKPWTDRRRDRRWRAGAPSNRWLGFFMLKGKLFPIITRIPAFVWLLLDRLHLIASPSRTFDVLRHSQAQVLLVFGEREWGHLALKRRGGARFRELLATGRVELTQIAGLDHSMFNDGARDDVLTVVRAFLERLRTQSGSS